jgi:hypothetical protein
MSTVNVRMPDSLHAAAGDLARKAGVSVDQLIAAAVAEKVSAMAGPEWLSTRAARGDRAKFEAALSTIADVDPEPADRL